MGNKPKKKIRLIILYFILFRIIDIESIMWDIADFMIKPFSKLRHFIALIIKKQL